MYYFYGLTETCGAGTISERKKLLQSQSRSFKSVCVYGSAFVLSHSSLIQRGLEQEIAKVQQCEEIEVEKMIVEEQRGDEELSCNYIL